MHAASTGTSAGDECRRGKAWRARKVRRAVEGRIPGGRKSGGLTCTLGCVDYALTLQVQLRATGVTRGSSGRWGGRTGGSQPDERSTGGPIASANLREGSGASVVARARRELMAVVDATGRRGEPREGGDGQARRAEGLRARVRGRQAHTNSGVAR